MSVTQITKDMRTLAYALMVKVVSMKPLTRESVIALLKQVMIENVIEKILTPEECIQFIGYIQECSSGVATTGNR